MEIALAMLWKMELIVKFAPTEFGPWRIATAPLVLAWFLWSGHCFAQASDQSADFELTRDQWQQRVIDARRRSDEFVANARNHAADTQTYAAEQAEVADQRAMNDPGLQRGDIIVTSKGFLEFVGSNSDAREPSDFRSVQHPQSAR